MYFILDFIIKNKSKENNCELTNKIRKLEVGNETAKPRKNNKSPKPIAKKKDDFNLNFM
ncbi:hypothetical protein ACSIGC_05045 [Tenacibaculum sp. ZS6-P6]|uniref:hypothetical protein n=1 Tax=Tenacibaculum sp. ZS6-P6 TaxID=3447503 RepID=UPI003F9E4D73